MDDSQEFSASVGGEDSKEDLSSNTRGISTRPNEINESVFRTLSVSLISKYREVFRCFLNYVVLGSDLIISTLGCLVSPSCRDKLITCPFFCLYKSSFKVSVLFMIL